MFVITKTPKEFIPSSQKDEENPLIFIVQPPTKRMTLDLQEQIFKCANENEELSTKDIPLSNMINLYINTCVIGWKNVEDENGKALPFSLENLELFNDSTILIELYNFCRELSEGTEKN